MVDEKVRAGQGLVKMPNGDFEVLEDVVHDLLSRVDELETELQDARDVADEAQREIEELLENLRGV